MQISSFSNKSACFHRRKKQKQKKLFMNYKRSTITAAHVDFVRIQWEKKKSISYRSPIFDLLPLFRQSSVQIISRWRKHTALTQQRQWRKRKKNFHFLREKKNIPQRIFPMVCTAPAAIKIALLDYGTKMNFYANHMWGGTQRSDLWKRKIKMKPTRVVII